MNDPKAEQLVQQFFTKKSTRFTNTAKSVTIEDEVERLDYMNFLKIKMLESGEMKKHLWTKQTILFWLYGNIWKYLKKML